MLSCWAVCFLKEDSSMCAVKDRNKDVRQCSIIAIMNVTTVIVAMVSNEASKLTQARQEEARHL